MDAAAVGPDFRKWGGTRGRGDLAGLWQLEWRQGGLRSVEVEPACRRRRCCQNPDDLTSGADRGGVTVGASGIQLGEIGGGRRRHCAV